MRKVCENCHYYTTDGKCQYHKYKRVRPHDTCFMHWPFGVNYDIKEKKVKK